MIYSWIICQLRIMGKNTQIILTKEIILKEKKKKKKKKKHTSMTHLLIKSNIEYLQTLTLILISFHLNF